MSVQATVHGPFSQEDQRLILIVDDEPSMRTALTETVRRLGYQVKTAVGWRRCHRTDR